MATNYIGNNDYRGYLSYLAQNGDTYATALLGMVGNDGVLNPNELAAMQPADRQMLSNFNDQYIGQFQSGASTGGASSASTSSSAAANPFQIGQFDQSIGNTNAAIGRLGNQQAIGEANIEQGASDALNTLLKGRQGAQASYDTSKLQTGQDYSRAKNTISSNVGNTLSSALRILQQRGAGGSSAFDFAAPEAAARTGTLARADVGNTFARNQQNLDTNFGNYNDQYNSEVANVGTQKQNQRNSLQSSIAQTRAKLLESLATLTGNRALAAGGNPVAASQPYLDQSNSLLSLADNLGRNAPSYNVNTPAYQAPSLSSYTTNPNAPVNTGGNALTDTAGSFLNLLLGKKRGALPNFV